MVFVCAALAVFLDFLLQVTTFVALIIFDSRRAADNRVDCFPCVKVSASPKSDTGDDDLIMILNKEMIILLLGITSLSFIN